jgi:hypothetical protein
MNKSHLKNEINLFYEEFIIYPFIILRSKNQKIVEYILINQMLVLIYLVI